MLNEQFKSSILEKHGSNAVMMLSSEEMVQTVGHAFMVAFIDLNERLIRLTDDIILEIEDFLMEFPKFAKGKIQIKRLKRYGSIFVYSNNGNPHIIQLLERSPDPDFELLSQVFGEPEEVIRKKFDTGH